MFIRKDNDSVAMVALGIGSPLHSRPMEMVVEFRDLLNLTPRLGFAFTSICYSSEFTRELLSQVMFVLSSAPLLLPFSRCSSYAATILCFLDPL